MEDRSEETAVDPAQDHVDALPAGALVGKYEIVSVLGQGGFGITYRALDARLGREIAIKEYLPIYFAVRQGSRQVLPRSTRMAEDFRWGLARFLDEARMLARLTGTPGIVDVFDFVETNGTAYMVMALARGETLEAILTREKPLGQSTIDRMLPALLSGLERIHAAGVLHRDIKPSNILIDADGRPTLIDFGASRAALQDRTHAMTAVYTAGYAPFEQVMSDPQGPYTDIYALAATLYHCVTGAPPPTSSRRMSRDELEPASTAAADLFAPALLAAIDAGLALHAADRPQSVAAWRGMFSGQPAAQPGRATVPAVQAPPHSDAPEPLLGVTVQIQPARASPAAVPASPHAVIARAAEGDGKVGAHKVRAGLVIGTLVLAVGAGGVAIFASGLLDKEKAVPLAQRAVDVRGIAGDWNLDWRDSRYRTGRLVIDGTLSPDNLLSARLMLDTRGQSTIHPATVAISGRKVTIEFFSIDGPPWEIERFTLEMSHDGQKLTGTALSRHGTTQDITLSR